MDYRYRNKYKGGRGRRKKEEKEVWKEYEIEGGRRGYRLEKGGGRK